MPPSDDDTISLNVTTDTLNQDLGIGDDTVRVSAAAAGQVRITFTSAEVGNGNPNDAGTMTNQDGGLAVRVRLENGADVPTGPLSRFDDEGITFESATAGLTFDVRDLVAGTQRGDQFEIVRLGAMSGDAEDFSAEGRRTYVNAGMGNDTVTGGRANDFLVGGAGDDVLSGGRGDDSLLGGAGNDTIFFNVSRHGADSVDGGLGDDVVRIGADAPGQVRLTFTSAEVGNGLATDSGALANQDGGLAVRLQAEDGAGNLTGAVSRFDDEGMEFRARSGVTFDVRDLVSGVQRGDGFEVARLGTSAGDVIDETGARQSYYVNAGGGNDSVTGGDADDFLVGGAGDDTLTGSFGADSLLGGAGLDTFSFDTTLTFDNANAIVDFSVADDTIRLDSDVFTGLMAGALDAEAFALRTDAEEADDRIIYDAATGVLSFDANGGDRSDSVVFATLVTTPATLSAADFVIA